MNETLAWSLPTLAALALLLPRAWRRLELSRAKHPSLAGHSRLASWLAASMPGHSLAAPRVFGVDGAPPAVLQRRRASFERLAAGFGARHPASVELTRQARARIADLQFTAAHRVPFPFSRHVREHLALGSFLSASTGCRVTDLDGREFIDLSGSYGVNVFGHDFYKSCIAEGAARAAALGPVLGHYHPAVAANAETLCRLSGMDEVSFHMSGTEAVMQAVRLARYHTGRRKLVRFAGAYHGWWDDVQPGPGNPLAPAHTYTLREMDERSLRVLRRRRDIACVLVNPVQALHPNRGAPADGALVDSSRDAGFDRAAYSAWLQRLREVCRERGIALILDEVFVGFRLAPGGAQAYFGVEADLVTYGKTLAGGLPVGVVCGRLPWTRRFRDDRPAHVCFARGTFNAHPYVMSAMQVFLERLQTDAVQALYRDLDAVWDGRAQRLNERLERAGVPVRVANLGTIWTVLYRQPSRYNWMLQFYLRAQGLLLSWVGTGRLVFSLDIGEADFDAICERFVAAALAMQADGWWWHDGRLSDRAIRRSLLRESLWQRR